MEQKQKDALWAQYTKQTHRLGRVLWERANEAMTAFDYQRLMLCNELLRGNAYAWIYRDPRTGWPRELIPLPPDYMTIHVDLDGHVWYFFTHHRRRHHAPAGGDPALQSVQRGRH